MRFGDRYKYIRPVDNPRINMRLVEENRHPFRKRANNNNNNRNSIKPDLFQVTGRRYTLLYFIFLPGL